MKFLSEEDKILFLMEVGDSSMIEASKETTWQPPEGLVHHFIKRRATLRKTYKDFHKSQAAKAGWRENKWKYLRGIARFHKSAAGKRFHRALGRFIATRIMKREEFVDPEYLVAASSLKTHLYLELLNYLPLHTELELVEIIDDANPVIESFEKSLLDAFMNAKKIKEIELSEDVESMLLSLVEKSAIVSSLASASGRDVATISKLWDKAEESSKKTSVSALSIMETWRELIQKVS